MRTQLIKITLAASILLAYAFTTSCSMLEENDDSSSSSGTGNPGSSPSSNPGSSSSGGGSGQGVDQLYMREYDCGEDDCGYFFIPYTSNADIHEFETDIKVGTVINGNVNLQQLSAWEPDEGYLSPVMYYEEDLEEYCSEYSANAGGVYRATFRLKNINYGDEEDDEYNIYRLFNQSEDEDEQIIYWYFSKAGKLVCNYEDSGVKYNLDVVKGWNKIYVKSTTTEDFDSLEEYSTTNILTKGTKWFSYPYMPGGPWFKLRKSKI